MEKPTLSEVRSGTNYGEVFEALLSGWVSEHEQLTRHEHDGRLICDPMRCVEIELRDKGVIRESEERTEE